MAAEATVRKMKSFLRRKRGATTTFSTEPEKKSQISIIPKGAL